MGNITCSITGCTGKHLARGWCSKHYNRWRSHGDPLREPPGIPESRPCAVDGCYEQIKAKGLCSSHLEKKRRYGSPTAVPPKLQKTLDILAAGEQPCNKCGEVLPLSSFSADRTRPRGFRSSCKRCDVAANREYIARNAEQVAEMRRAYRKQMSDDQRLKHNAITSE